MKVHLWVLLGLLAGLLTPGNSDCRGECVACGVLLQQQHMQHAFNTMVCLLECEGHASSSLTWQVCRRAVELQPEGGAAFKRTGEELQLDLDYLDPDQDQDLDPDQDPDQDQDQDQDPDQDQDLDQDLDLQQRSVRLEDEDLGVSEGRSLSKRFGGFQRGRHGYRKLIGSPARPIQKRYGGFIGVRKSARKWNSQKRVNQLLRQYLGMRSSRGNNNSPAWRQNRL